MVLPFFKVGILDRAVVGFVLAVDQERDHKSSNLDWFKRLYNKFLYIDRIVVHPEFRGCGVGNSIYRALKTDKGNVPMLAEVSIDPMNLGSIRFHERFGFRKIGEHQTNGHFNIMYALE